MSSNPQKPTAHSTVRVAKEAEPRATSPWSLDELAVAPTVHHESDRAGDNTHFDTSTHRQELIEEGYRRGFADGAAHGAQEAEQRLAEAGAVLGSAVSSAEDLISLAPRVLEENVAALAVVVAQQILMRQVGVEPMLVADLVRRALTEFPIDQAVRIRVHPADLSLLSVASNGSGAASAPITGTREASWVADARVARGGCLIEGRDRIIDGRVDVALERAYRRMTDLDA